MTIIHAPGSILQADWSRAFRSPPTSRVYIISCSFAVLLQGDLFAFVDDSSDPDTEDSRTKHRSASKNELPLTSESKADTKAERKAKSQAGSMHDMSQTSTSSGAKRKPVGGMHEMSQTTTGRGKASASDLPANQRERSRWATLCIVCLAHSICVACWAACYILEPRAALHDAKRGLACLKSPRNGSGYLTCCLKKEAAHLVAIPSSSSR